VRRHVKIEILVCILVILAILTKIVPMNTTPRTATTINAVSHYLDLRITSTQSRINSLNGDANRWNDRYIRSLLAVLFIGLWTLVCQFFAIQRTRMVSDAQSELLHLKDIKAANESRDSRDKGVQISEANQRAEEANRRAGTADAEAGRANARAAQLSQDTEALRSQNLATQRRLLAAEEALEQEKKMRLELQKSLAPRDFSAPDPSNVAVFDAFMEKEQAMKQFAGIEAAIEVIPDLEARRAAGIIEYKIKEAGWVVASNTFVDATPDGVTLWRPSRNLQPAANELKSEQAAGALAVFLEALGWQDVKVQTRSVAETGRLYIPPNKVVIQVGFKPNRLFDQNGSRR
jgi:hypothetical protein